MLLVSAFLLPILAGTAVSFVRMEEKGRKTAYAVLLVLTDLLALFAMLRGGAVTLLSFSERVTLTFAYDTLGRYFLAAVLLLYSAVTFYAFEYMDHEERPNVFFAFHFISFGMMIALSMAGNLVTMYLCFEMVTLSTVPLVLHELSKEAVAAGMKYMFYSIGGALLGLFAVFFVYHFTSGDGSFVRGGFIDPALLAGQERFFLFAVFLGIVGFGTKAGLYPMHGWLPTAHPIAPAPASALLSGIVAKAGVLAIIRLAYFSVGEELLRGTWVQYAWMILAMVTIFMGSMMAFREKILKKRLAFSTVSQISYILLGLSFLSDEGLRGGLLHMMSHVAAKGCLFLVAGIFIVKLGVRDVRELRGVGRRMPLTLACFTLASLSLVGIPPMGGFLSKWVLASVAIDSGLVPYMFLAPAVLLVSALLTAGYLLPIMVDGFFPGKDAEVSAEKAEPSLLMTVPLMVLCAVSLVMGLFGTGILASLGF